MLDGAAMQTRLGGSTAGGKFINSPKDVTDISVKDSLIHRARFEKLTNHYERRIKQIEKDLDKEFKQIIRESDQYRDVDVNKIADEKLIKKQMEVESVRKDINKDFPVKDIKELYKMYGIPAVNVYYVSMQLLPELVVEMEKRMVDCKQKFLHKMEKKLKEQSMIIFMNKILKFLKPSTNDSCSTFAPHTY
jgi:hypothetical protein